ncbi:MAG: AAA family ATPase [Methylococcales bacterium]|nr:AAA family ATPase [Methylococcales bacterium]
MTGQQNTMTELAFYQDNHDHLVDELRRLDILIQLRVELFQRKLQKAQEAVSSQPTYISHGEVDWLLSQDGAFAPDYPEIQKIRKQLEVIQKYINAKVSRALEQGIFLALPQLAHLFGLSPFEIQAVVICLAPELRRKYDKLYAYLQDDITRKKPSVDLVLDLLCETEADKWNARAFLSGHAPLMRAGILQKTDDPHSPSGSSGLAQFLNLDHRILDFLLGRNHIDTQLIDLARLYSPSSAVDDLFVDPAITAKLLQLTQRHFAEQATEKKKLVLYFYGPYGVGKQALALTLCGQLGYAMLSVDMELLLKHGPEAEALLRLAFREGLLMQTALYFHNVDALLKEDNKAILKTLSKVIAEYASLVFLTGEKPWAPKGLFEHALFHAIELSIPDVPLCKAVWEKGLQNQVPEAESWAAQLASQFRLTPGQIQDAFKFAGNECAMRDGQKGIALTDLYRACRHQSNQKLSELAVKIEPRYGWEDLVLPDDKLVHLKEICSQVKHRYRVFGEWGFDKKLSYGKGLSMLFSGSPGTGKTMAAQVIAGELQLDLYKIDLSGVVSKYIGETEKNLAKIFQEAETSNAILFFDEADALFGKRTEVSDAHDRYANIETSYLLQKMEEYEGVVIMATNLCENMDDAFTRRIRFIVEFPFPDEVSRLKIWQTHIPKEAPLSEQIDFEYLSQELKIAGGSIKNIVLNSAFLAAENGGVIGMEHVLRGAKREFEKIGKLWNEKDARQPRHVRR